MTIAYRGDLNAQYTRVVVNGTSHNIISISTIGDQVGLRLTVEAGTE